MAMGRPKILLENMRFSKRSALLKIVKIGVSQGAPNWAIKTINAGH